ncbi:MAG: hypothetical protein RSA68_03075 [Hafnia sp.]|uniref:hypothetical protein n=1 Tax=Hafnia sp. TaxID=1873498 RepID=UPI002FCB7176
MAYPADNSVGKPFFGYMTSSGPVIVSHPELTSLDVFQVIEGSYTSSGGKTTNNGGGGMEKRLAVLEAEVSHIKTDVADIKSDLKKVQTETSNLSRDVAVILQKVVDIDSNISKKPSSSEMTAAIASATNKQIIWTIGIAMAILGFAKYIF